MYYLGEDNGFGEHFVFALNSAGSRVEVKPTPNSATFLAKEILIEPVKTGSFHKDLTEDRDDILIAILSLLLLLSIHSVITTILLRTSSSGAVSNFEFSVAQFFELVRDFRHHAVRGKGAMRRRGFNVKVAVVATVVVVITFGLEVLILFLSERGSIEVTNHDASFSLDQPVVPRWHRVRDASLNTTPPCKVLFFKGVEQRKSRLTACLSSSIFAMEGRRYKQVPDETEEEELKITSDLHEYGARHIVEISGWNATYTAAAYMSLGDSRARVVTERQLKAAIDNAVKKLHNTFIGFIASAYNLDTKTNRFTLDMLNGLKPKLNVSSGDNINVIKVNNKERYVRVVSQRFVTEVTIPKVGGPPTLSLANIVFKDGIGITISGPNEMDLIMGSGNRGEIKAPIWYERTRGINWLTLCVLLGGAWVLLIALRRALKPISTADLAAVVVKDCVGAERGRSPMELAVGEEAVFAKDALESWAYDDWDQEVKLRQQSRRERHQGTEYET